MSGKRRILIFLLLITGGLLNTITAGTSESKFYIRGAVYQDWLGFKANDVDLYSRLSSRLKLTLWNRPGTGWTVCIDLRNRYTFGHDADNQLIIYNTYLTYDKPDKKIMFSLGQMNLYDTAGIGMLTGGVAGYKLNRYLTLGGYAGIEPDIYNTRWETDYQKFGMFFRFLGKRARQISVSYNQLRYAGETERQFLYFNGLWPMKNLLMFYGHLQYELGSTIKNEDRLSWVFANIRLNLTKYADLTGHYSSGRGLDTHRFLLDQSQDPTVLNTEIDRYFFNTSYGVRLSIKPVPNLRLYVERRQSEQIDEGIENHTTRLGISATNIFKSGISMFGNYNLNRGELSESDSYYISASRSFGKLSWSLSYANYYNGVLTMEDGTQQIFHLTDHQTISSSLFFILNKHLAFSLEYAHTRQDDESEHQFFVRLIYRR